MQKWEQGQLPEDLIARYVDGQKTTTRARDVRWIQLVSEMWKRRIPLVKRKQAEGL